MKMLFDLFPIVVFFAAYHASDIYVATAVAIAATFVQIGWVWFRHRKVDKLLWVSLVLITVFGGATLIFREKLFIQWKPTVLYWLFAVVLATAAAAFKKNLIRSIMEKQVSLPDDVWTRLLVGWIVFFVVMGALNLYVAFNFSEPAWVNFKMFGGPGLTLAFVLAQALMLSKHVQDKNERA